jgi:hypothetical protein
MRCAAIRTRKLARDMLIFWKRVDKEQVFILPLRSAEAYFKFIPFFISQSFSLPALSSTYILSSTPLACISFVWFNLAHDCFPVSCLQNKTHKIMTLDSFPICISMS